MNPGSNFTGKWVSNFGVIILEQAGDQVHGNYTHLGQKGKLRGTITGKRLHFTNQLGDSHFVGWFELQTDGRTLVGEGTPAPGCGTQLWEGTRHGFQGWWQTTFGLMDLTQVDGRLVGTYARSSRIEGREEDNQFIFDYYEPRGEFRYRDPVSTYASEIHGKGEFTLSEDGLSFEGRWLQDGASGWASWQGKRLFPQEILGLIAGEMAKASPLKASPPKASRPAPSYAAPLPPQPWSRRRKLVTAGLVALVVLGASIIWWWGAQAKHHTRWQERISRVETQRLDGKLQGAEAILAQVETEVAASGPLFPLLRSRRAVLEGEIAIHKERLKEAKRQEADLVAVAERLARARKSLDAADVAAVEKDLKLADVDIKQIEAEDRRELINGHAAQREKLKKETAALHDRLAEVQRHLKSLADVAAKLAGAKEDLVKERWTEAEAQINRLKEDLSKSEAWSASAKVGASVRTLKDETAAFQKDFEAAYRSKLKDVLDAAKQHLAKREFAAAEKLIDDAANELGAPDPVLHEAKRYVRKKADEGDDYKFGPEQEKALAGLIEHGLEWKRTLKEDTKSAYDDFLAKHPDGPLASAASGKLAEFKVKAAEEGKHVPFPDSGFPGIPLDFLKFNSRTTIMNNTPYTLTVNYRGPDSRSVDIAPHSKADVTLEPGRYTVAASVSDASVLPFVGSRNVQGGFGYSETFYIKTTFGPRTRFPGFP